MVLVSHLFRLPILATLALTIDLRMMVRVAVMLFCCGVEMC